MNDTDAVLAAVRQFQEEHRAFMKSVRWRTWAIAGWAVAVILLLVIVVGSAELSAAKEASKFQNAELLKTVDRFNKLALETNRSERMLVTYANGLPPGPAAVDTVPVAPAK